MKLKQNAWRCHASFPGLLGTGVLVLALGLGGCDLLPLPPGPAGPPGPPGEDGISCWDLNENGIKDVATEDTNNDGVVDVFDCRAGGELRIGNGSDLTDEEIAQLGRLQVTIDSVTVGSPPVVEFTVLDKNGDPAIGLSPGVVSFTFAKLVPATEAFPSHWQSYINRKKTSPSVVQGTTDSSGALVEPTPGHYQYTFATDVTNVTSPIPVAWEPGLTHRVGLEIRLSGAAEGPLAPLNPVLDFVPNGGTPEHRDIAATESCAACHKEFAIHGGPRKTVEYCVTCHNIGSWAQSSAPGPNAVESIDMAYMAHSIHSGENRHDPYVIRGYSGAPISFGEVTYPQSRTYCETCHTDGAEVGAEAVLTTDGGNWNKVATARTCGGCHEEGLVVGPPNPDTGESTYQFDHDAAGADADIGMFEDGTCYFCHLGAIPTAGPALAIHSHIRGDQRWREALGKDFVFEILSATDTSDGPLGPGDTPRITFKVKHADGTPYDIINDPEFTADGAALNLYVAWPAREIYNGDEAGSSGGMRDRGPAQAGDPSYYGAGLPSRMYLAAIQDVAVNNGDGSFTVDYFTALPADFTGDPVIGLGGHPRAIDVEDADGVVANENAAAESVLFFPGAERQAAYTPEQCNACHKQLQFHGGNRNGNTVFCLICHNADLTDGGEGFSFGRMIHSIHAASTTFNGGRFAGVTFPQSPANCDTCHKAGAYNTARAEARAGSTGGGATEESWLDDTATTPTAAVCGVCHTSNAARGHFESNGGQVDTLKSAIAAATPGGLPNGLEGCAVCHGPGALFDTVLFHNPGAE